MLKEDICKQCPEPGSLRKSEVSLNRLREAAVEVWDDLGGAVEKIDLVDAPQTWRRNCFRRLVHKVLNRPILFIKSNESIHFIFHKKGLIRARNGLSYWKVEVVVCVCISGASTFLSGQCINLSQNKGEKITNFSDYRYSVA